MSELEDLEHQIGALRIHTKAKLALLCKAIAQSATVSDFFALLNSDQRRSGISALSKKTASSALHDMESSKLLVSQGGRGRTGKRYSTSNVGIAYQLRVLQSALPTIGESKKEWDDKLIERSLIMELGKNKISKEEAKEIAQHIKRYTQRIGWGGKNVGKPFVRQLIVETLMRKYEETNIDEYLQLAQRCQPIGGTERSIEDYTRVPKADRVHVSPPEEYIRELYMLRKIGKLVPLLLEDCKRDTVYIHGLLNAFNPFNFNHDFRLLFSNGITGRFVSLRKPANLKKALDFAVWGLTHCQSEIAGSQTLDHWNWIFAPYLKEDKKSVNDLIESFIDDLWMQYVADPRAPLYSNIVVERIEDSPITNEVAIEPDGNKLKSTYATYEDQAHSLIDSLLMMMANTESLLEEIRWHPSVFLRVSAKSIEKLSNDAIDAIMKLIYRHTSKLLPHSIYFVNMDSATNKNQGHLTYFREISRISAPKPSVDSQAAVFTFMTINLLGIIDNLTEVEGWKGDPSDLVKTVREVIAHIIAFNDQKAEAFERKLITGQARMLSMKNPSMGDNYFKMANSSIHLGLFGFEDVMSKIGLNIRQDLPKLLSLLREIKKIANALFSEVGYEHQMAVELAQPPSRSGVYPKCVSHHNIPMRFSHFNLTPHDIDRKTQLEIESQMHELLLGGSISRIYLDPDEEAGCLGFVDKGSNDTETFRKFILEIVKSSSVPLFQVIPLQKSAEGVYPATGRFDTELRTLRNAI